MKILYCEQSLEDLESLSLQGNDNLSNAASPCPGALPPVVTLLTDSSLSRNRLPLFLPPGHLSDKLSIAPVIKICRLGKFIAPRFASRYYNEISLMARLVPPTPPAMPASATLTAFDSAAVVGDWTCIDSPATRQLPLSIAINDATTNDASMSTDSINSLVAWLSSYFTLRNGDLIVPGIATVATLPETGSYFTARLNNNECLQFKIK